MASASPSSTAAKMVDILNNRGQGDYIGERVSQLAHCLQAAQLAKTDGADDETVIAALLHDIGQFLPAQEVQSLAREIRNMDNGDEASVGRAGHESIGQEYLLRNGFSHKVGALVGSHVAAKRYLCAVDPSYHATLSEASQKSLIFQGGPMAGAELNAWSANPWCAEMVRLRKWDDGAKVVGMETAPAESYREMMEQHLQR